MKPPKEATQLLSEYFDLDDEILMVIKEKIDERDLVCVNFGYDGSVRVETECHAGGIGVLIAWTENGYIVIDRNTDTNTLLTL